MSSSTPGVHDLANLSNHDIQILFDIVTAAEQSSAPPFRALLSYYEQVLAQHGIPKDSDQTYFRFLLRMGEFRNGTRSLFEQFESLLSKLGIKVALDGQSQAQDGDAVASVSEDDGGSPSMRRLQTQSFRPARRSSLDSALNANANTQDSLSQLQLLPARPKSLDSAPVVDDARSLAVRRPSTPSNDNRESPRQNTSEGAPKPTLGMESAPRTLAQSGALQDPPKLEQDALEANDSGLAHQSEESGLESGDEYEPSDDEHTSPTLLELAQPRVNHGKALLDDANFEEHARSLRFHHLAVQAICLFRHWRSVTDQAHGQRLAMAQSAQARDAATLKRQAFDQWKLAVEEERHHQEREKFYQTLEARATTARTLFILTKAFTHWAQCATDEVSRKKVARQRILMVKYFNAWRNLTVLDALKVKRQGLTKFISAWKGQTAHLLRLEDQAVGFRASHLASNAFQAWTWQFCERRAPSWHDGRLQRAVIQRWRELTAAAIIRRDRASEFRQLELQRQCLVFWTQKSNTVHRYFLQALDFRRERLLAPIVETLQRELRLAPLLAQCTRTVETRVVRLALDIWIRQAREVLQARAIDRSRITRNAWTAWNDNLRCKALQRSISERVIGGTLYKWVLAERSALCDRVRAEKLMSSTFGRWRSKTNALAAALGRARHLTQISRNRRTQKGVLAHWSSMSEVERQEDERARRLRDHHLTNHTLAMWSSAHSHCATLRHHATRARFYMLTTTALKQWRTKATESRKDRRRDAYATIRRRLKMSLARGVLQKWQAKVTEKQELKERAEATYNAKMEFFAADLLAYWQDRLTTCQETSLQASTYHSAHILQRHLRALSMAQQTAALHARQASAFLADAQAATATTCLRKLSWQLFSTKQLVESGERLAQRNERNHYKGMLRHWAATVRERRNAANVRNQQASVTAPQTQDTVQQPPDTQVRAEQWTPFTRTSHRRQRSRIPASIQQQRFAPPNDPVHPPNRNTTTHNNDRIPDTLTAPTPSLLPPTTTPAYTPSYTQTPTHFPSKSRSTRIAALTRSTLNAEPPLPPAPAPVAQDSSTNIPPTNAMTTALPSTPAPPPTMLHPFTQAQIPGSAPTARRGQITPFMRRLRAQYPGSGPGTSTDPNQNQETEGQSHPPASTGLFTRTTGSRFTRGRSGLSSSLFGASLRGGDAGRGVGELLEPLPEGGGVDGRVGAEDVPEGAGMGDDEEDGRGGGEEEGGERRRGDEMQPLGPFRGFDASSLGEESELGDDGEGAGDDVD